MTTPLLDFAMLPRVCGVYAIRNTATGECYVGGTKNIRGRVCGHVYCLKVGVHMSREMRRTFRRTPQLLVCEILERCEVDALNECELFWFNILRPTLNKRVPSLKTVRTHLARRPKWRAWQRA